ncbi:MAG: hypothetical protein HQL66_09700 [Magnetococcales bacterium]|nr:hypothetical protein [Magnetococcales bacterium]
MSPTVGRAVWLQAGSDEVSEGARAVSGGGLQDREQQERGIGSKILAALYVGGAYGLIIISLVQVLVLLSWLRH